MKELFACSYVDLPRVNASDDLGAKSGAGYINQDIIS